MKKLLINFIVIFMSASVISAANKPDMKFINSMTSKVFDKANPLFDPKENAL